MSQPYYENLALIGPDSDATLEGLKTHLEKFYASSGSKTKITLADKKITLNIDGYNFHIHYNDDESVIDESVDMSFLVSSHPNHPLIAASMARFEMHGDDDPDFNYMNDSMFIQEAMEKFKEIFIFNPSEGAFMNF